MSSIHAPRPDTTPAGRAVERNRAASERRADSAAVADSLRGAGRVAPAESDTAAGAYYVVKLPAVNKSVPPATSPRSIPDVSGLPVRSAARILHSAGFRVELMPGSPGVTIPAAGTLLEPGRVVKLGVPK